MQCVEVVQVATMQQWYVQSLDMKGLLLLAEEMETIDMNISCGIILVAMEMKILYLIVGPVTSFMKDIPPAHLYLHMHVKVSLVICITEYVWISVIYHNYT